MMRELRGRAGTAWRSGVVGVVLVMAAGLPVPRPARAETGVVQTLPGPSVTPRSGLRMTVDTRWAQGPGYRPVRIQLRATKAGVADRTVTVVFRAGQDTGQGGSSVEVEQQIDFPAGATAVEVTLAVPHYEPWRAISWETWIDGRRAAALSTQRIWLPGAGGYQNWGDVPAVLVIGTPTAVALALGGLAERLSLAMGGRPPSGSRGATIRATRGLASEKFVDVRVAELPVRWSDYSCIDIVCLSADELRRVATQEPAAWQAITAWTRAGGNLWVYALGDDWKRLDAIEQATGLRPLPAEGPVDLPARGWQLPTGDEPTGVIWPVGSLAAARGSRPAWRRTPQTSAANRPSPRDTDRPGFAWRDVQFGQVLIMASAAPFPGSALAVSGPAGPATAAGPKPRASKPVSLEWVLGAVGPERFSWEHRHGLATRFPTNDFWNFLIPGVGLAPVTAFHVLITLFVLALGPLNYFLLYRRNRLHLLVVTVPISAVIVTAGLFAYALLADGLATRVRARSLTLLDQRQGHVVRWARLSYYAGLAPPTGLTFPADTVVYPLLPSEGSSYGGRSYQRLSGLGLQWRDRQHLTRGWLRARTPTQYVTLQSTASRAGLQLHTDRKPIQVINQFGSDLRLLILADTQGQFHWAHGVQRGTTVPLAAVTEAEAIGALRTIIADAQLRLPPGMQGANRRSRWTRRLNRFGVPKQAHAMPERIMKALTIVPSSSGSGWEKAMYVAVANSPAGIDLGVADPREEASLHLIVGRW